MRCLMVFCFAILLSTPFDASAQNQAYSGQSSSMKRPPFQAAMPQPSRKPPMANSLPHGLEEPQRRIRTWGSGSRDGKTIDGQRPSR